jgi:hypothetical protein
MNNKKDTLRFGKQVIELVQALDAYDQASNNDKQIKEINAFTRSWLASYLAKTYPESKTKMNKNQRLVSQRSFIEVLKKLGKINE